MKFRNSAASVFVPDGLPGEIATRRVTHLGIGAHPDDLEILAFHGIIQHFKDPSKWFAGVTCTHGSGSPRNGRFAGLNDGQMRTQRQREQETAARIGRYAALIQLDYASADIRGAGRADLRRDIETIMSAMRPDVVYTHNPADRHETHVAVFSAVLDALRALAPERRPSAFYGCEVWRSLDWLNDEDRVLLDVSGHEDLARQLLAAFESQVEGGKRYDLAVAGRRRANATFADPRSADTARDVILAMDLLPLLTDTSLDPLAYVLARVERFKHDVILKLGHHPG